MRSVYYVSTHTHKTLLVFSTIDFKCIFCGYLAFSLLLFLLSLFSSHIEIALLLWENKQQFCDIIVYSVLVSEEFNRLEFCNKTVVCASNRVFLFFRQNDSEKEFKNSETETPNISSCKYTISDVKNKE